MKSVGRRKARLTYRSSPIAHRTTARELGKAAGEANRRLGEELCQPCTRLSHRRTDVFLLGCIESTTPERNRLQDYRGDVERKRRWAIVC